MRIYMKEKITSEQVRRVVYYGNTALTANRFNILGLSGLNINNLLACAAMQTTAHATV